ncbi:MAG: hypothetical protein EON88_02935 [Brevundimonas sp.]|nr:MAG: hypothetical protein EON88_02935 [Brevundimonas sp.]
MSAFEFFFSFYGLVLGLSVVEIVAGVGRMVDEGHRLKVGWLTPLLAAFLGLDIASFWISAWAQYQHAPLNYALLILGLVIAGLYYIAAYLVFPRHPADGAVLDDHYWTHRRLILGGVFLANLLNKLVAVSMLQAAGILSWGDVIWPAVFYSLLALAIGLPRGRMAAGALVLVLMLSIAAVAQSAVALINTPVWAFGS